MIPVPQKYAPELASVLNKLFQFSYDAEYFPDSSKNEEELFISNKGSKTKVSNYQLL